MTRAEMIAEHDRLVKTREQAFDCLDKIATLEIILLAGEP